MNYRCAILGCGPRARGHADAYKHISRGKIMALCDLNKERLSKFGEEYGVAAQYVSLDEMLEIKAYR